MAEKPKKKPDTFKGTPRILQRPWNPGPLSRKCGDCRMCCIALPVIAPEYDVVSHPGEPCRHLCASGCGVYGTPARPRLCHDYACNWLRGHGSVEQRPDRMGALPTIAEDRRQLVLYLAPGLTPDTMSRAARAYARTWLRRVGSAVLYLYGEGYHLVTAEWPDGVKKTEETTYTYKGGQHGGISSQGRTAEDG
jgi:hypothetical protein